MSGVKLSAIVLACMLPWVAVSAADDEVVIELTGADLKPSSSDDSTWGWWAPDKFDDWRPDERSELVLGDLRMLVSGDVYTVILAGEWAPELTGTGTSTDPATGEPVTETLDLEISAYDLVLGQAFGREGTTRVMPWVGATYVRIAEDRATTVAGDPAAAEDRARTTLWGATVGADLRVPLRLKLELAGRVVARWATGDRDAELATPDPGSGSVELSDSVDRTMWGADLGLRWTASPEVAVEAGYRLRDWSVDDGPVSYSGLYLKAVFGF